MLRPLALSALLLASLVGCTADAAAPPSTPSAVRADVDWDGRIITVEGPASFGVDFCEGSAPILCVETSDGPVGTIELLVIPGELGDVAVWAAGFYEAIGLDRAATCGTGYRIDGDEPTAAPFGGEIGARYSFTGTLDGRRVERVVGHVVEVDGDLHLLVANALADDGCLARESELPIDVIDDLEPLLTALADGSTLPEG